MKRELSPYFRSIGIMLVFLFLSFIGIFIFYLKFEQKLDFYGIRTFLINYLWLFVLLFLVFIYYFNKRIIKPIQNISRTTQRIFNRRISSSLSINNINDKQLIGAINQLADQIEAQLHLLEENSIRLQGVVENMSSGVILVTRDRRIALINQATEELFAYPKDEFIGKRHLEAIRHTEINNFIEECFSKKEVIKKELSLYYPKEKIVQVSFAPMKSENNDLLGVVVILNDITDIRQLEHVRTDFVANVSHELRTPITSIKGFTETLLDGAYNETETSLHFLKIINLESDRLLQIVNDLLDLSKIESNQIVINRESFNFKKLVNLLILPLESRIVENELTVELDIADDLAIEADKSKLSQIIVNLLNNAIMYTQKNGLIRIGAKKEEIFYEIYIEDNGIGIEKENLKRIFERFYRIDKSRVRAKGGTGLGLAIVKHLVEAHNGEISVESKPGAGTKFKIHLPR